MTSRTIGTVAVTAILAFGGLAACSGDSADDGAAGAAGSAGSGVGGQAGTAGTANGGSAGSQVGGSGGSAGSTQPPTKVDKIDLLLMIDNSASMADKQQVLAKAVPDLVQRLANPVCIDGQGNVVANQPAKPLDPCPSGSQRQSPPVFDIHVGVVSSSLGGHGADTCAPGPSGGYNERQEDMAHLIQRNLDANGQYVPAATYANKGFLNWDPTAAATPPGDLDLASFTDKFAGIVKGVGQDGCGFEASLESWYRFLVDPAPYAKMVPTDCSTGKPQEMGACRGPSGVDQTVLSQRKDFLRPDSLVVIAMLTDEDDCSADDSMGQAFLSMQAYNGMSPFHLPRATSACKTNPASPDCKSCGMPGNEGDPECQKGSFYENEDPLNLRCFHQKQRFGIDFLYPTQRYADALSKPVLEDGRVNPLFCSTPGADGKSCTGPQRNSTQIVIAGIVGVPWQLLANDPKDLKKGYKPAAALPWDAIAGDADNYVDPSDPFMVPSIDPRTGTSASTGEAIKPVDSGLNASPVNGHEWNVTARNDLQYACVFDLPTPKSCESTYQSCDCATADDDGSKNPLCQAADGSYGTTQYKAKAYPTPRILNVFKKVPNQAVVASICAPQLTEENSPDYGYRAAISALVERIRPSL